MVPKSLVAASLAKDDLRVALGAEPGKVGEGRGSQDWPLTGNVTVSLKEVKVGPSGIVEAKLPNRLEK